MATAGTSARATATDRRHLKARARSRDDEMQRAYEHGRAGRPYAPPTPDDEEALESHRQGDLERRRAELDTQRQTGQVVSGSPQVSLPRSAAGAVWGLLAWSIGLSYLKWGWPGVTSWFSAKLMNKPTLKNGVA